MSSISVVSNPINLTVENENIALSVVSNPISFTVTNNEIEFIAVSTPIELVVEYSAIEFTVASNPVVIEFNTGNVTINYGSGTATVVASEALSGHRIVTVEGYYASKDTSTDKYKILGMTTGAVVISDMATVQTYGEITNSGWSFTVGLPVFLGTNGEITQSAPTTGFRNLIGYPKTSTILFIEISEPYILA